MHAQQRTRKRQRAACIAPADKHSEAEVLSNPLLTYVCFVLGGRDTISSAAAAEILTSC